jgi:hypothetical protein
MSGIQLTQTTPAVIGVLMLDTKFPRPPGDVGNSLTFNVPMHYDVFRGIWPAKVVASASSLRQARTVPGFQHMIRMMQMRGVKAVTTSCGFLVLLQKELQSVTKIPVVTSSLLQLPALLRAEPQVGVLTISAAHLGKEHLKSAGVSAERMKDVIIEGMPPASHFAMQILGNHTTLDLAQASSDVVQAALRLKARAPRLKTLLLECTNMPPYKAAIEQATGWQVRDLRDDPRLVQVIAQAAWPVIEATAAPAGQPPAADNAI